MRRHLKTGYLSVLSDIKRGFLAIKNDKGTYGMENKNIIPFLIGMMALLFMIAIHIGLIIYAIAYFMNESTFGWSLIIAMGLPYIGYRFNEYMMRDLI